MHSNGWGTFMKKIITIGLISMLLVGCDSETQTEEKTFVLELGNEVDKVVLDDQTITSDMEAVDVTKVVKKHLDLPSVYNAKIYYDNFSAYLKHSSFKENGNFYDETSYTETKIYFGDKKQYGAIYKYATDSFYCPGHRKAHVSYASGVYVEDSIIAASYKSINKREKVKKYNYVNFILSSNPSKYYGCNIGSFTCDVNEPMRVFLRKYYYKARRTSYAYSGAYSKYSSPKSMIDKFTLDKAFKEYQGYEDYYKYSFQLYENYIVVTNENPFGFNYITVGKDDNLSGMMGMIGDYYEKMISESLENNYSIKTKIYLNLNSLEIDKWEYKFHGMTNESLSGVSMDGYVINVDFELTKAFSSEQTISSQSSQLFKEMKKFGRKKDLF